MPRGKGGKTRYAKSAARAKQRVQNAKKSISQNP